MNITTYGEQINKRGDEQKSLQAKQTTSEDLHGITASITCLSPSAFVLYVYVSTEERGKEGRCGKHK